MGSLARTPNGDSQDARRNGLEGRGPQYVAAAERLGLMKS
jgi:hypothetical protein